jgi:hypothetical protein
MSPRSLLLLLVPMFLASGYGAIDLTPAVTDLVEDGVTYREVSFKTPEGKILLTLSPGWAIRGQTDRAQITGTDKTTGAVIEAVSWQKPEPLDEAAIMKFKEQVVAALPAGSTKITAVSEAQNAIMPGNNPSFEIVITYDLWGKIFQRSAILVNGPQDRIVFRFTALKQDFQPLNTQFRRMVMTWRVIEAQPSAKTVVADASVPPPATN